MQIQSYYYFLLFSLILSVQFVPVYCDAMKNTFKFTLYLEIES